MAGPNGIGGGSYSPYGVGAYSSSTTSTLSNPADITTDGTDFSSSGSSTDSSPADIPDDIFATDTSKLGPVTIGKDGEGGIDPETQKNLDAYKGMSDKDRHKAFDDMMNKMVQTQPGQDAPTVAAQKTQAEQQAKAELERALGYSYWTPKTQLVINQVMPAYMDQESKEQIAASKAEVKRIQGMNIKG